ncbi:hypothetical protein [Cupriavidus necator]|uniref:hypothetical protein n=1 Tax=Cupriavidus necator TaxID=106590 RepID=UPI0027839BE9|nr:hypothetical protein [Cupriavidus necator]MDQ0139955.1 hypothetical protein [Cupriavidus necator]
MPPGAATAATERRSQRAAPSAGAVGTAVLLAALACTPIAARAWVAGNGGEVAATTSALAGGGTSTGPYRGYVGPPAQPDTGEPATTPRQWDRALPFFAQRVIDKGYDLPNPYDIGYSYFDGHQRYQLSGLSVSAGSAPLRSADFVRFDQSRIRNTSHQVQVGAWLFPFMNVYGMLGTVRGSGDIGIRFSSLTELERFFGIDVGCGGRRPRPDCANPIRLPTQHASYSGHSYGAGFTLVGAYGNLFFSLPVTFTVSDISMSDTPVKSLNIGPRVGWNFRLGRFGVLTPYVGATWFRTHASITGHFDVPVPGTDQTQRLNYQIDEKVAGAWSGSVGMNWTVNKYVGLLVEVGYGYNRNNVIATGFLRF